MRYSETLTFPIILRRDASQLLQEQIAEQIAAAIETGAVRRGARIPSTRSLAELLGVSRGVAAESYDRLHARGYLVSRRGSGTFVRFDASQALRHALAGRPAVDRSHRWVVDLSPGQHCAELFPIKAWRAAWRQASHRIPDVAVPPALGLPALRRAIADHLARTRGIVAPGHDVVVTQGTAAGLRLILEVLGPGAAIEQPASPDMIRVASSAGPAWPMPVGSSGADISGLPEWVRVAVVCPDANRPLGTVMSAARRREAAAWAREGRMLVEVSPDGGCRPETARVPRLLDLGARTAIIGGFCGLLTPSLGVGYALVPKELADPIGRLIADRGEQPLDLAQLAVAQLMSDGTLLRQARRLTNACAAKRAVVQEVLSPVVPVWKSAEEGIVLVGLPHGVTGAAAADQLRADGIRLPSLCSYLLSAPGHPQALVLGFGHLGDRALRRGLTHLHDSWQTHYFEENQ